jgi:hypothetical protein
VLAKCFCALRLSPSFGDPSFRQLVAQSDSSHSGKSKLYHRRRRRGVAFVKQILHRAKDRYAVPERPRDLRIEHEITAERIHVLIVVVLFADRAPRHGNFKQLWIRVPPLEREGIVRHLRDPQPHQRNATGRRRVGADFRVDVLIPRGKQKISNPGALVRPRFSFSVVINVGVEESVTFAIGFTIWL